MHNDLRVKETEVTRKPEIYICRTLITYSVVSISNRRALTEGGK